MKLERVSSKPGGFTTVGYWWWDKPNNKGTLTVQVTRMKDWRHELAVWGHELIEVFYCWVFRVTTEEADVFDAQYERWYESGFKTPDQEPGCDPSCPYHWGHMLGIVWEHLCILLTFASWEKYNQECNEIMGI